MRQSAPWPQRLPRPKGLRAVARHRGDGGTDWHWYCRQTGARLPDPKDPSFTKALDQARAPVPKFRDKTVGAALYRWRNSPEFRALRRNTQIVRNRYTRPLDGIGHVWLADLRRAVIMEMRDLVAARHGNAAANMFIISAGSFLSWCIDREMIEASPASRIKRLPTGHFQAWTEEQARLAMTEFPEPVRRAVVLAYHTGQRRGDLVGMKWSAYDGYRLMVKQEKTGVELIIPAHPELKAELDRWKAGARGDFILTSSRHRPWVADFLSLRVKRCAAQVGLPAKLGLHGLRKLAAARLADAGASVKEIAAITGHATLSMVALYTASADQRKMAEAAVGRLSQPVSQAAKRRRMIFKIK